MMMIQTLASLQYFLFIIVEISIVVIAICAVLILKELKKMNLNKHNEHS